jgi:hypothetical protein
MKAIHIRRQIDSDTLRLPELQALIGKTVEIIILEDGTERGLPPGNLDFFMALAPRTAPVDPKEIEAIRKDPKLQRFWPLLEIAGQGAIDADAIAELRAASMT